MSLDIDQYKIKNIVSPLFDDTPVNLLDFTLHLQPHIALDKRLTRDSSFRPEYAFYNYNGENYARRRFRFDFATNGLIMRRREYLCYYHLDGSEGEEFLIKDRTFNHGDAEQFQQALAEQINLRKDIVAHIKTVISQVVAAANPMYSLAEIIIVTDPFFQELTSERIAFVEIGSHDYSNKVKEIDLSSTPHSYLAAEVAPGVSLRDYIVGLT